MALAHIISLLRFQKYLLYQKEARQHNGNYIFVLQIVFDILAFIGYIKLAEKLYDTYEWVDIESVKIRYLEKQSDIFKDSIKLQNESLRDVFDLTKKVIEYSDPKELDAEKHDTKALVSGWDADEIDEPELVSVEEFRKDIDSMACQRINPYEQQAIQSIVNNLNCQNMYPWNPMYYYNGRFLEW